MFFTAAHMQKRHRQFIHLSASKLYDLFKKAQTSDTTPATLNTLQQLTRRYDVCQRIQIASVRFCISLGSENFYFNKNAFMDITYIGHKPVLHVVDAATRFSAACFLLVVTTTFVRAAFVECWASVYVCSPNRIQVNCSLCFGNNF